MLISHLSRSSASVSPPEQKQQTYQLFQSLFLVLRTLAPPMTEVFMSRRLLFVPPVPFSPLQ